MSQVRALHDSRIDFTFWSLRTHQTSEAKNNGKEGHVMCVCLVVEDGWTRQCVATGLRDDRCRDSSRALFEQSRHLFRAIR